MPQPDILFAEDFDAVPEVAPPDIIEPLFTAEDLAEARENGRLAGLRQAEQGLAASRNQLLAEIAAAIAGSHAAAAEIAADMAEEVARAMLSATAALLPFVCARQGAAEIRALTGFLLPRLQDEPHIAIQVNPAQHGALQDDIAALEPRTGTIELIASDAVAPGDIRIAWHKGGASRRTAPALDAVKQAFRSLDLLERDPMEEDGNG